MCVSGWLCTAIIFYSLSTGMVFGFQKDWKGIGKIGAIIGLVPGIGGIYVVFFKYPKRILLLIAGMASLITFSFSIIGAVLIIVEITEDFYFVDKKYKLVGYCTAFFMILTGISGSLFLLFCLIALKNNSEQECQTPSLSENDVKPEELSETAQLIN